MPRVPDILADPEAYDVLSWDLDPGDAVAFHLASLHGTPRLTRDIRSEIP